MVATLEGIKQALSQHNLPHEVNSARRSIMTVVKGKNLEQFPVCIRILDGGQHVEIVTPSLFRLKDFVFKGVMFQAMLDMMGQFPMVRWAYDSGTGESWASAPVLVSDAELTGQQLMVAIGALVKLVDEIGVPRLMTIVQSGRDPGSVYDWEQMLVLMRRLLPHEEWEQFQQQLREKFVARNDER